MDPSFHPQVTIWGSGIWIARPRELGDGPFLGPSGNDLEDSHLDRPAWARGDELSAMTDKHVSSFQAGMNAAKVNVIVHWTSSGMTKSQIKSEPEINAESNVNNDIYLRHNQNQEGKSSRRLSSAADEPEPESSVINKNRQQAERENIRIKHLYHQRRFEEYPFFS